jgi:hypothetical protein
VRGLWHDYDNNLIILIKLPVYQLKNIIMENIKSSMLVFIICGLLILTNLGQVIVMDQETAELQWQEIRDERQHNIKMDQLPWAVQETLMKEFKEWTPSEVLLDRDPSEGVFYEVKLNRRTGGGTKTVKISSEGKVLEETDGERESEPGKDNKPRQKDYKGKTWFV